jgi:hypothetical protein
VTHWGNGAIYETISNGDPNLWGNSFNHPYIADKGVDSIINRSSPHRPSVDLPLFLFELKDLPGMAGEIGTFGKQLPKAMELIKDAGRSLMYGKNRTQGVARALGGGLLSYNMGWRPLMDDLLKMTGLGEAIKRRQGELKRLADKGFSKRVGIGSFSETTGGAHGVLGKVGLGTVFGTQTYSTKSERYAVVRWKANGGIMPSVDSSWTGAMRSTLGLNLSPATIWNMIPWSFAIDYFAGIGDFLDTYRNSFEMRVDGASIMQHSTQTITRTITERYWTGTGGEGALITEIKSRSPISLGPRLPAITPFLSGGQVSNLASLSVARRSSWRN